MQIELDNLDRDDGAALVLSDDVHGAKQDRNIHGVAWEFDEGLAYALIPDGPELIDDLKSEGYDISDAEYWAWTDWEEFENYLAEYGNEEIKNELRRASVNP